MWSAAIFPENQIYLNELLTDIFYAIELVAYKIKDCLKYLRLAVESIEYAFELRFLSSQAWDRN